MWKIAIALLILTVEAHVDQQQKYNDVEKSINQLLQEKFKDEIVVVYYQGFQTEEHEQDNETIIMQALEDLILLSLIFIAITIVFRSLYH